MSEDKHPGGRPLKFESPKALQDAIDGYFASCLDENGEIKTPYTITGLALALDTTRRTLLDYEERDEFSHTIKMAKLKIENFNETRLHTAQNVTGPIFCLKNFGWSDKVSAELTGSGGGPIETKATNFPPDPKSLKEWEDWYRQSIEKEDK